MEGEFATFLNYSQSFSDYFTFNFGVAYLVEYEVADRSIKVSIFEGQHRGACFLEAQRAQLLKETCMRIGEALRPDWNDIDFGKRTIVLNDS